MRMWKCWLQLLKQIVVLASYFFSSKQEAIAACGWLLQFTNNHDVTFTMARIATSIIALLLVRTCTKYLLTTIH